MKSRIVLLFGGRSPEHEVSVRSACSVFHALDHNRYEVEPVAISKAGTWLSGPKVREALLENRAIDSQVESAVALLPDPNVRGLVTLSSLTSTSSATNEIAVVFPVLHGRYGEDGALQGLLEMANLPYIGCGLMGATLGMDKAKQKEIFSYYKLPIANFYAFYGDSWTSNEAEVTKQILDHFGGKFPLFVKPANTGSSVGISKVKEIGELKAAIGEALRFDAKVIVEEGLEDIREIEVSVIGNLAPRASVCGEIVPSNEFYDYEAKYISDRSEARIPADLPGKTAEQLRDAALTAFRSLDCRGLSRVDFFVSKNNPSQFWINEINTLPGFTSISMYPKLWEASGLSYSALIEELIRLALEEWERKQRVSTSI